MSTITIGYAGLTHLGINSAFAAVEKGFEVFCYDAREDLIAQLRAGELPVSEPGLAEIFAKRRALLSFTSKIEDLSRCEVAYVALDVPTDELGNADLSGVAQLVPQVHEVLDSDAALVVLSQVRPGFTRSLRIPRRHFYYQVETLIFGRAVERALYPERFIVGCADPEQPIHPALAQFLGSFGCPLLPMRYESAELAKISINCCLVSSVSVANTLAEICEHVGADWSEIVPALKLDARIGQHAYLSPGLGIAGGNLERDLAAVIGMADATGSDARVVQSWVANSRYRRDWALRTLHRRVLSTVSEPIVGVLGLAYKQDTDSIKNSPSVSLLNDLRGVTRRAFDPVVPASSAPADVELAASASDVFVGADAVVVMTPWKHFAEVDPVEAGKVMRRRTLLDPYRRMDERSWCAAGFEYLTLGTPELK